MPAFRNPKIQQTIGKRIQQYRKFNGLSQTNLAQKLGVTFQQIQKYENGTNRISAIVLCELSKILKVPMTNFLEGIGGSKTNKNLTDYFSEDEVKLIERYRKLRPNKKSALHTLLG